MSNIAPISYPVSVYADENGVIAVRVIFQDSDLSDVHSLALNTTEMLGSGTVVSDDTFHYDPGTAFDYLAAGETASDTFSYTVTDSAGESSTSTITITITGQNDGPVAAALAVQTDENTAIIVSPDFIDPDTNDTHTFTVDTTATLGSVTVNVDGTFSYDPNGMFDDLEAGETATDTFTYTVTDAAGETSTETVTVTVHGLSSNTPPTTFPVELTADEDGTIVFRITYQDPDVGDTHTYTVNTDGLLGTLTETSDGTFDYTPGAAFDFLSYGETGTDTFTYTVTDNFGGTSTSTVTLTITGQNDAPVASAMNVTTQESNPLVITPDFVDPDASDTHTFTVDTTSTTGTVTINSDGTFTYNPNGNFDDLERGETATDAFTYTVTDNSGESSTQTVTVTIQGEGDINATAAKLLASDGAEKDQFGFGTQVNDHGVVVVGSYADDDKAANSGSVYVYTPEGDGYVETKLVASDGASVDNFGRSVAVNNSGTIAVSAFHDDDNAEDSGSIYVYTPTAGGGYSEVKLTASDGVADHLLGATLSMNSDGVIAASAHGANSDRIYIFTPDGSGGYTETKLVAPGTNGFGVATLNINDNGVVFADGLGALAYVFTPDGSGGYTQLQLSAPDSSETFGIGGAVENDGTIVVGSEGAIYIYEPDGSGNYIISKMMTGSGTGRALSINESGIIVAGSIEGNGAAYVYIPDGSGDYQELVLTAFDGAVNDNFGRSVSINEDGVITIGAYGDDDNGSYSGSVYVFTPNADGNYVGPDGTIYQPTGTPVIYSYGEYHEVNGDGTTSKLLASDGAEKDQFGFGTQVNDHGVVVVGSYADDDKAANSGSVYVYTPEGDGYVETKLVASDGASVDNFGRSVAVNNSGTIAVSAFHDDDNAEDSGSIYVYTPTAGGGYSEVKLTASDGVADHLLGATLSMNSDGVIAASAHGANSDRIYIFTPDGSGGYTETKLVAPGTNGFGVATLNINDNGVVFADGLGALAYVFTPDGSGGYTQLQLSAPDSSETFGIGGAVENDGTIVVGSEGAIYIYEPDGSGNYIISKMMTGSGTGRALSINESGIIVAGSIEGNGAAYVYIPDGSGDYQELVLTAFDGAVNDNFGRSVSINEDGVITIGAYGDDDNGSYSGSVSIFTPDADGNYVGPDGTIYQPTGTPVIETFDATELVITGTDAAEVLMGGNAADTIKGNGGDDSISGGAGDDQLTGGDGNDTFVFKAGNAGHDTVLDFTTGVDAQDLIELDAALFADYDAVLAAAHESGADTVITIDAETSVTLKGIQISDLDQSDFSFL